MGDAAMIIVLLLAAMVLTVAEIFLPTLGILAIAAALAAIGAVVKAFMIDGSVGLLVLLGVLIFFPIYILLLIRLLPKSPVGRYVFLKQAESNQPTPEQESLAGLVGREGVAETPLRLSGAVRIDGRRYQAMAENDHIDTGQPIRVVRYDGMDLIVKAV